MKNSLIPSKETLKEIIQKPAIKLAELATGILSLEKPEKKLIVGRIIQGTMKFNLLTQLGREIEALRDKGKIKEDYLATHKNQVSFVELLKFIDEEIPDEEVFSAMKSIFLFSVSRESKEADEIKAYELMKICKELRSGDILILRACYKGYEAGKFPPNTILSTNDWLTEMAVVTGFTIEMISLFEEKLMEFKLISDRNSDNSGVGVGMGSRITGLGLEMCKAITAYQE